MTSSDFRVTALLTEHLGFAPLTLVDEVINAVNKIMYNCTDALESFLIKRRETQLEKLRARFGVGADDADIDTDGFMKDHIAAAENSGEVFSRAEIEHGTAQLETLLVSHVDKNFDKFELYTLRNILTMPKDLVEDGWVRLKHHEHLDNIGLETGSEESSARIKSLIKNIRLELQFRKLLQTQLNKAKNLVRLLRSYKKSVDALISRHPGSELSEDTVRILKTQFTPMNENIYFLLGQSNELMEQTLRLSRLLIADSVSSEEYRPTNREEYLRHKTSKLLESIQRSALDMRPSVA